MASGDLGGGYIVPPLEPFYIKEWVQCNFLMKIKLFYISMSPIIFHVHENGFYFKIMLILARHRMLHGFEWLRPKKRQIL